MGIPIVHNIDLEMNIGPCRAMGYTQMTLWVMIIILWDHMLVNSSNSPVIRFMIQAWIYAVIAEIMYNNIIVGICVGICAL